MELRKIEERDGGLGAEPPEKNFEFIWIHLERH
jgi:hypothetical protein